MRSVERTLGLLAGLLGVAAFVSTLTQHPTHIFAGMATYGAGSSGWNVSGAISEGANANLGTAISVALATGVALLATRLVALSAVQDARARGPRSPWRLGVVAGALLSLVGGYLLIISNLWAEVGVSQANPVGSTEISAALLFAPAMLAAILCALAALAPRSPEGLWFPRPAQGWGTEGEVSRP
jgi:hypothetical protein